MFRDDLGVISIAACSMRNRYRAASAAYHLRFMQDAVERICRSSFKALSVTKSDSPGGSQRLMCSSASGWLRTAYQ